MDRHCKFCGNIAVWITSEGDFICQSCKDAADWISKNFKGFKTLRIEQGESADES